MPPLTEQVKDRIRRAISHGELRIGEVLPRSERLASQSRCSVGTVERALTQLAGEGVLTRVPRRGTIVAMRPSAGRVCLVLSNDPHTNLLLHEAVYVALTRADFLVDAVPAGASAQAAAHCRRLRQGPRAAESIVAVEPVSESESDARAFREAAALFPRRVVFSFGGRSGLGDADLIRPDHRLAARLVAEHFIGLGHQRIAVFAGAYAGEPSWAAETAAHCREFVEAAGAEFVPVYMNGPGIERLHAQQGVTAFWDLNDYRALLALNACLRSGLRVPGDVSIAGRNDTPWGRDCRPALTTVSVNPEGVAKAILAAVAPRSESRPAPRGPATLVSPRLVVRDSTGKAKRNSGRARRHARGRGRGGRRK